MKRPAPVDLAAVFRRRLRAVLKEARPLPADAVLVHALWPAPETPEEERVALGRLMLGNRLRTWQAVDPATWPAGLPLPLTVREAVAAVRAGEAALVEELAGEVERCARELVPEHLARVLARRDVAERWPWHGWNDRPGPAGTALHALWTAAMRAGPGTDRVALLESHYVQPWPGEAAPLDVARWAAPRLTRLGKQHARFAADLVAVCERGGGLGSGTVDGARYPAAGLALLFLAERACRVVTPAAPRVFLTAVDPPARYALTSLGGADPRDLYPGADLDTQAADPGAPVELTFRWPDRTQLEIPWLPAGTGALVAVAHRFGPAAVRDVLALYLFTWAARAPADAPVWWWPDEHLAALGLSDDGRGEARRRLRALWADLNGSTLTARYPTGAPLRGPLVARLNTDGTAQELRLHPALYRGVTGDDGTPGRRWWPMPVELLRLPAGGEHGRVHVLAPVLGSMWRAGLREGRDGPPVARVNTERLAAWLNVHKRTDRPGRQPRHADPRAGALLRATLEAGVACGLVESWSLERGDLDSLTGVLRVTPGEAAREVCELRAVERPARLPATGDDLARWLTEAGLTSRAAGELLALPGPTVRRVCSTHRGRPLPPDVRAALRRHLWPDPATTGGDR